MIVGSDKRIQQLDCHFLVRKCYILLSMFILINTAGDMKTVPSVYTLLMNAIYSSHRTGSWGKKNGIIHRYVYKLIFLDIRIIRILPLVP